MKSSLDKRAVFETMPVRQAVCRQIIPAIASQMIALIYNLADTYFVGMLNKPNETAAVTVAYSSFLVLTAISNLFGVGGASALSSALGRKNEEEARDIAAVSFWGGLVSAAVFSLLYFLFAGPVLVLCGAAAAFGVSLGGILNTVLDPFFVLPRFLGMGAVGAGIANGSVQLCGCIVFPDLHCHKRGKNSG